MQSISTWFGTQFAKWKRDARFVLRQAHTLVLVLKHSQTPWLAKLIAGCTAAYLLSPIQLIPTFIPIIGQMDDLLVLFVGMKLVRKFTPEWVMTECETRAKASVCVEHIPTVSVTQVIVE